MATQKRFIAKNGIDNNSNSIINVANPTNAQDVATKNYVDALAGTSGNQRTVTTVTPTVGQTVFTIAYTVGYIDVFYNGVKLVLADDFVATNGTSVTLTNATIAGDVVEFVTYLNVALANTYTQTQANSLFAPIASPTFTGVVTAPNSLLKVTTSSYPTIRPSLNLDFANSQSVDPRITFTRASTATRVNANGLIEVVASGSPRIDFDPTTQVCKGLLIEEQRTNLLTYSENFDNAVWARLNATISASDLTSPDGMVTADKIVVITSGTGYVHQQVNISPNTTYTRSIYLKAGTAAKADIGFSDNVNSGCNAFLNFSDWTITFNIFGGWSNPSASIFDMGNGWKRVIFTCTSNSDDTVTSCYVWPRSSGNGNPAAGDYFYAWGAQLEAGSFATSYIPSSDTFTSRASTATYIGSNGLIQSALTGVARYNYNPVNLSLAPKLLLESASTNLLTYSEQFDNAAWTKINATVTANATTAPDGTVTADKIVENTSNATHYIYEVFNPSSGIDYTYSFYAKSGEKTSVFAQVIFGGVNSLFTVNLSDGTKSIISTNTGTLFDAVSVGNGWYRCSIKVTTTSTSSGNVVIATANGTVAIYTGDGTSGVYIWGAQLEVGSYPTSYIPTVASQVTRAADISSSAQTTRVADNAAMTGTNFSSWYNQTEGTVLVDYDMPFEGSALYPSAWYMDDGTYANRFGHFVTAGLKNCNYDSLVNGVSQVVLPLGYMPTTVLSTYSYKQNDFVGCAQGGTVFTDTSGIQPIVNKLQIGGRMYSAYLNGHISKLSYYPKRLTNSELQALTTG